VSNITTRNPIVDETPALHRIWNTAFGKVGMESFFQHIFNPEMCLIAESRKSPVAMGHLIPNGKVAIGSKSIKCAMIYSVATLPGYRSKGFGTMIVNDLINLSRELGYPAVVLCPSNDELFTYYSQRSELLDCFYVNEQVITEAPVSTNPTQLIKVSAKEYNTLREKLLKELFFIKHDLNILKYQEELCSELGGGLYRIGDSCAVIERQENGTVLVKEMLTPDLKVIDVAADAGTVDIIASIATEFPSKEYTIRLPSQSGMWRRFGMLALSYSIPDSVTETGFAPWYGMAFD